MSVPGSFHRPSEPMSSRYTRPQAAPQSLIRLLYIPALLVLYAISIALPLQAQERGEPLYQIRVEDGRVVERRTIGADASRMLHRVNAQADQMQATTEIAARRRPPGLVKGEERPQWIEPASLRVPRGLVPWTLRSGDSVPEASQSGWETILAEGFEDDFPGVWSVGYDSTGADAYWGGTEHRAAAGSRSIWAAAGGEEAGRPGGNYPNDLETWSIYGPFDLSDATDAQLAFRYWNDSESGFDYLGWYVSTNGVDFAGWRTSGNSEGWQPISVGLSNVPGLSDVIGSEQVWIAFHFESDFSISREGPYVDEVLLQKNVLPSLPDLVASTLYLETDRWVRGASVAAELTETNVGMAMAGTHETRLYLSEDQAISDADTQLGEPLLFDAIEPDSSAMEAASFAVPVVEDGIYYLGVIVDAAGEVAELDESNAFLRSGTVDVRETAMPDLISTRLALSADPWMVGDRVVAELTEENRGLATAGAHGSQLYLSSDAAISADDTAFGELLRFGSILPDSSAARAATLDVPELGDGTYFVGVIVDALGEVEETDERNVFVREGTVEIDDGLEPVISVSPLELSETVQQGESSSQTVTVQNEGEDDLVWRLSTSTSDLVLSASVERAWNAVQVIPANYDVLAERAEQEGGVPLIVGFESEYRPEAALRSPMEVAAQRQQLARDREALLQAVTPYGVKSVKRFRFVPFVALHATRAALQHLATHPRVASIREDEAVPPALAVSTELIGMSEAWAAGYSGEGQTVAILDTGVDSAHPFLEGKVIAEACYSTTAEGSSSLCPGGEDEETGPGAAAPCTDGCDHGTHVAGIAAGRGETFSGVARDADIIAVQVFSRFDDGRILSFSSDQIRALEYVYSLRETLEIAAVNMSLGGGRYASTCDEILSGQKQAIDNLRAAGIATVVSSGNNGFSDAISGPACISSAVSVGSTGSGSGGTVADEVSGFSNSAAILDLLAPGQWIESSVPGGGFESYQGTSMAAPHVAGAWAVLKQKDADATVDQVLEALNSTGVAVADARNGITKPRIQVDAALGGLTSWLAADPVRGTVAPGTSQPVTVTFDAADLAVGTYEGTVAIRSDDPQQPTSAVAVGLTVEPPSGELLPPNALEASLIGPVEVLLGWTNPDGSGNDRYVIYRDTVISPVAALDTVAATASAYTDTGLEEETTYFYRLAALDADGERSEYSGEVSVTTGDATPPTAPTQLAAEVEAAAVALSWVRPEADDLAGFHLYRGVEPEPATALDTLGGAASSFADSSVIAGTFYYYRLTAVDSAGNESAFSNEVSAVIEADDAPPAAPTALSAERTAPTEALFRWTVSASPDAAEQLVYLGTAPQPTVPTDTLGAADTTYVARELAEKTAYYFRLRTVDGSGNISGYSEEAVVVTGDTTAPDPPARLVVTAGDASNDLAWDPSPSTDLHYYRVYRGERPQEGILTDTVEAALTAHHDDGLRNGTTYYYRITAVDSTGNESRFSNEMGAGPYDQTPPDPPADLVVRSDSVHTVDLQWSAPSDADVRWYRIYRDTTATPDVLVDSTEADVRAYTDTDRSGSTTYYYRVTAVDSTGNESGFSAEASVTTPSGVAVAGDLGLPGEVEVKPNYPNPFSQSTTFRIGLPSADRVTMTVYDLTGRQVAELPAGDLPAGWHEVEFIPERLPSGAYLCRVVTDSGHSRTLKMVLLR